MVYSDGFVQVEYTYTKVGKNVQEIIDLETGVVVEVEIDPNDEWEQLMLELGV